MKWLLPILVCVFPFAVNSVGDDVWPQFHGKNRDGIAHAISEIKPWPKAGPRLAWQVKIGEGFSGLSVSGDRIFTMFADGKNEFLTEAGNGKALVAFDKPSGHILWTAGYGGDGYCSPTSFIFGGERQFLFVASEKAVALSAAGNILWQKRAGPGLIAMPLFIASDKVFILGSGEANGVLLKISKMQNNFAVEEVWSNNQLRGGFNSPVFYNGHLYGFSGSFLVCVDLATGTRKWTQRGFGEGSVVLAGGHLIVMGGKGNIALVQATPEKYLEAGSFQALQGKCWTSPTIAQGKLLLRNHVEMVCYDLAARN